MSRRLLEILEECECLGVHLEAKPSVSGEPGLSVRGNPAPDLREDLRRSKPNILAYLRTGRCHHELPPEDCKVCNGYARKLIEEGSA
jgi:hypothetical protein